ncbi:hypothetical protein OX283_009375 [Flavobacterium sp. SUN052]|uniref:hypothetical protein n=1 Tax=Flavobacterium sp. SUN052 TaxID=3002441 RepID=UPI00237EBA75|nr:hypothetical protein [Flavobacterium sp. SUN052]MEC4004864.1 hypothetical protein [Flavobacterium sp. SUN052]
MTVISKYPVFEADQVLSQSHLNSIVSYFETQDRATRKGLIGIGIVCGLDVSFPTTTKIKISCGTALTSLGFQINWEEKIFSKYKLVDKLSDTFLAPNLVQEPFLRSIFDYTSLYNNSVFTNFEELIEDPVTTSKSNLLANKQVTSIVEAIDVNTITTSDKYIPNARFLDGKVIVLLLEVSLIDQKKCSETNCDDKGKRLEFNLRPILISASKLVNSNFLNTSSIKSKFESLYLERFNAPQITLINGQQLLNAFESKAGNPQVILQIDKKIKTLYTSFQDSYFTSIDSFDTLSNVNSKVTQVLQANRTKWHVQYVWDWLNDIVAAYNEIIDYNEKTSFSYCCSSTYESQFPLHVFLGKIETKSGRFLSEETALQQFQTVARFAGSDYNLISDNQNYITPWIKVSSKEKKDEKLSLKLLLERLVLILNNFSVVTSEQTYIDSPVKVTPSFLGDYPLSKKSIPYYYSQIPLLNRVWNPRATIKGTNDKILSYHSAQYSAVATSVYPLNYDIEAYDFFRIEGIIGRTYKQVLDSLLSIRKNSQLPFNVIAINAINLDNVLLNMSAHIGEWNDIELDYDLVRRDWENVIGKSIEWFEANSKLIVPYFNIKQKRTKQLPIIQTSYDQFVTLLKNGRNSMVESFSDFIKLYVSFIGVYEKIEAIANQQRKLIFDGMSTNEDKIFAEDLIDHFDQIIYVCQKGEFRALYEAAQTQWNKTSKDLSLVKFIEKHPGMEHKAGVTKGGTFILVYQDTSVIPRKTVKQNPTVELVAKPSVTSNSKAIANELVVSKSEVFNISIEDYKTKVQAYASNYLTANSYNQLIHFMDNLLTVSSIKDDLYGIPNQTVIADFYLPYLCCSEGTSINFVIGDTNSGPADFNNPDFASNDFYTNKIL